MFLNRFLATILVSMFANFIFGQCSYIAGYSCATAPVICDLNCLNNFKGTLLDTSNLIIKKYLADQPGNLCTDGGNPQNLSWFAFVAGSNQASLTITPSNCKLGLGIQVGIFGDCNFNDNLNSGGTPVESEFIACKSTGSFGPITLEPNNLVKGQTYYFYVDGSAFDVCSYTVKVNNAAMPTELDDLISFDQLEDTLFVCKNQEFQLSHPVKLEINYNWRMTPNNSFYNLDQFTRLEKASQKFKIDSTGIFTFELFANNGCDGTDTIKKIVVVKDFKNEIFTDLNVCESLLPIQSTTLEDPNGDGFVGWFGKALNEGINLHNVEVNTGCSYTQSIKVVKDLPLAPISLNLEGCGPIIFRGKTIPSNTNGLRINIPNSNPLKCDSIFELNTMTPFINGSIIQSSCKDSKVEISFVKDLFLVPPSSRIKFIWKDIFGNILLDDDNDSTNIKIDKSTKLLLQIGVVKGAMDCSFYIDTITIDPTLSMPPKPITSNWNLLYCEGEPSRLFSVQDQSIVADYNWVVSGTNNSIINKVKNGAYINIQANGKTRIGVQSMNVCGTSDFVFDSITLVPSIPRKMNTNILKICKDSIFTSNYVENLGNSYSWVENNCKIIQNNNNSASFLFGNVGKASIILKEVDRGCPNFDTAYFNVIDNLSKTIITKNTTTSNLANFSWNSIPCATSYIVRLDGNFISKVDTTSYTINGLKANSMYSLVIEAIPNNSNDSCSCGGSKSSLNFNTFNCNDIKFKVRTPVSIVCEDGWAQRMQILHSKSGNLEDNKVSWSGDGMTTTGFFEPINAGIGSKKIIGRYEERGCVYIDTAYIEVATNPILKLKAIQPDCPQDLTGSLIINAQDNRSFNYLYLNGKEISDSLINDLPLGKYKVQFFDKNLCSAIDSIQLEAVKEKKPDVNYGENLGFNDQPIVLDIINYSLFDSITWIINDKVFCNSNCNKIKYFSTDTGLLESTLVYYYGRCQGEISQNIQLKQRLNISFPNIIKMKSFNPSNSQFRIQSNDSKVVFEELSIYSRWGEKVFMTKDLEPDVEVISDQNLPSNLASGVYVIVLKYTDLEGRSQIIVKDLTILK
jgi:hypothetical protein